MAMQSDVYVRHQFFEAGTNYFIYIHGIAEGQIFQKLLDGYKP